MLQSIAPFFIVDNLPESVNFYCARLGFELTFMGEGNFFAIVRRDDIMLMLKAIAPEIHPQPNYSRHEWARWDAYVNVSDPDELYAEYAERGVRIHRELTDTADGLRAFEILDNSGYVLCFGRPGA